MKENNILLLAEKAEEYISSFFLNDSKKEKEDENVIIAKESSEINIEEELIPFFNGEAKFFLPFVYLFNSRDSLKIKFEMDNEKDNICRKIAEMNESFKLLNEKGIEAEKYLKKLTNYLELLSTSKNSEKEGNENDLDCCIYKLFCFHRELIFDIFKINSYQLISKDWYMEEFYESQNEDFKKIIKFNELKKLSEKGILDYMVMRILFSKITSRFFPKLISSTLVEEILYPILTNGLIDFYVKSIGNNFKIIKDKETKVIENNLNYNLNDNFWWVMKNVSLMKKISTIIRWIDGNITGEKEKINEINKLEIQLISKADKLSTETESKIYKEHAKNIEERFFQNGKKSWENWWVIDM